jgi:hypothetical protein
VQCSQWSILKCTIHNDHLYTYHSRFIPEILRYEQYCRRTGVCSQSISDVSTISLLVAFYVIHGRKGEVLFCLSRTPHEISLYFYYYRCQCSVLSFMLYSQYNLLLQFETIRCSNFINSLEFSSQTQSGKFLSKVLRRRISILIYRRNIKLPN